jgi:hypothetical protein
MDFTLSRAGSRWDLGWLVNAYYSHFIHNIKEVGPQSTKGLFPGLQGSQFMPGCKVSGFAGEAGGIMEVAMWLCIPLLLGL